IRVAVVDESVQEFGCFPNTLFAALESKVFSLLTEDVSVRLVGVVQTVKFRVSGLASGSYWRNSSWDFPSLYRPSRNSSHSSMSGESGFWSTSETCVVELILL